MTRQPRTPIRLALLALAAFGAGLSGCDREEPLTREEASEALTEARISTEASAITDEVVTLTTDFTLGDAAAQSAANLRDFVRSQIPCADVNHKDRTVTIDFGAMGICVWRGRSWSGQTAVAVEKVDGEVEITHTWTALSDGFLTVDGEATVTWSPAERSRRVVHRMTWTDGEHTGESSGDRTQSLLDGLDGVRIDGARTWTGRAGRTWMLDIDGVELRRLDPVPQAGTYTLEHPAGKSLSMTFERVDETTIQVTVQGPRRSFQFQVTGSGGRSVRLEYVIKSRR